MGAVLTASEELRATVGSTMPVGRRFPQMVEVKGLLLFRMSVWKSAPMMISDPPCRAFFIVAARSDDRSAYGSASMRSRSSMFF